MAARYFEKTSKTAGVEGALRGLEGILFADRCVLTKLE
jgi:hypothetical protein